MTSDTERPAPLSEEEWLKRYQSYFVKVAHLTADQAADEARAEPFAVLSEGYEDDPEGAADMSMSYWSD